ncbi:MAG: nucleoside phosphorylase [Thermomicrobiales bacterium]
MMTILSAFDDVSEEVIRPGQMVQRIDGFPEMVVATYSWVKFEQMIQRYPHEQIATLNTACAPIRIYRVTVDGVSLAVYLSLIGGAAASAIMEEVIALGGRRFLFFGSCGVMDREILEGHIAVPTAAYRDDGTSYHYLPAAPYVEVPTAERLAGILRDLDVPYHLTRTWTTDAIYRETRANMEQRMAEGCRVVEMECASTAAVAQRRGVDFFQFVYGADSLDGDEWDPRSLIEGHDAEGAEIADLALKIAVRLA